MDLLSNRIKAEPIEDEDQANLRIESVDQEDELAVVMKCETLPEKPEVKCDEFGSMGVSGFDAESNIKIEYDPDSKFDAPIDE
nr:unnamed protein product [Callosobruchus chinensis]